MTKLVLLMNSTESPITDEEFDYKCGISQRVDDSPLSVVLRIMKTELFNDLGQREIPKELEAIRDTDYEDQPKWKENVAKVKNILNTRFTCNDATSSITNEINNLFRFLFFHQLQKFRNVQEPIVEDQMVLNSNHEILGNICPIIFKNVEEDGQPIKYTKFRICHTIRINLQRSLNLKTLVFDGLQHTGMQELEFALFFPKFFAIIFKTGCKIDPDIPFEKFIVKKTCNDLNSFCLKGNVRFQTRLVFFRKDEKWAYCMRGKSMFYTSEKLSELETEEIWSTWDCCYVMCERTAKMEDCDVNSLKITYDEVYN